MRTSSDPDRQPDAADPLVRLVGAGETVPCVDGTSTGRRSSSTRPRRPRPTRRWPHASRRSCPGTRASHRGAGYRSRHATAAYEEARRAVLTFAGRSPDGPDVAIFCRNTTEAINQLAFRLRLRPDDVVVTTVVEHHANLLPWGRVAERRYVECTDEGTFTVEDVAEALDRGPGPPALLAVTGASNVTGWLPPVDAIIEAGPPAWGPGGGRRRPAGPPPTAPGGGRLHRLQRAQALRAVRFRCPDRSPPPVRDRRAVPGRRGRGRPGGPGRGHLDRTARPRGGRLPERGRGRGPARGRRRPRTDRLGAHRRPRGGAGVPPVRWTHRHRRRPPARARGGRPGPRRPSSPWRPSRSRACTTHWWPPG